MSNLADRQRNLHDGFMSLVNRKALIRHARLLSEDVQETFSQAMDRNDFAGRYDRFLELMGES